MNKKTIGLLILITAVVLFFITFFILVVIRNNSGQKVKAAQNLLIGKREFKGKVINAIQYQYGGKAYYKICVRLDYTNVSDWYVYNDTLAIKIKNNIATFSGGVYDSYDGFADYVEMNMNNDKKMILHYKNGDMSDGFGLYPLGLSPEDLNSCK